MSTTAKAIELAHTLADVLKKRLTETVLEGFDASVDGPHPTITIGNGITQGQNVFIRIKPLAWENSFNVIGQQAQVYTPHIVQFATEAEADADTNVTILTRQNQLSVLGEIVKLGAKVEWYESANTVVPVVGTLIASNLKATFSGDLYWSTLASS